MDPILSTDSRVAQLQVTDLNWDGDEAIAEPEMEMLNDNGEPDVRSS